MSPIIETTMATKVNYDDNLFHLISLTKALRNGLQLELDVDYFRDKTVEDILFVDRTLQQIYEALSVNTYLINRKAHLRELMRAKRAFADMLDEIINRSSVFAQKLAPFDQKIGRAREQHLQDISDIQSMIEVGKKEQMTEDIVSQDEYQFLFRDEESDE